MRLSRDDYYLKMLELVASRSTCGRRAVGAIIIDAQGRVLATGYNGVPAGLPHCNEEGGACEGRFDPPGDSRRCLAVHAEINALLQCARLDLAHTLYCSCSPCFTCMKALCNTPIQRIVSRELYVDTEGVRLWREKAHRWFVVKSVANETVDNQL